ncbi:MAG: PSP1 domain-containing protein [Thermaceae bacterium]
MTVGIRFRTPRLLFARFFGEAPPLGSQVVVRKEGRLYLGQVRTPPTENPPEGEVLRLAKKEDLDKAGRLKIKAEKALSVLKTLFREKAFPGHPFLCEYDLEETALKVYLARSEEDKPLPFREILKQIRAHLGIKAELIPQGPRERAALVGTLGACGMESCCSTWLAQFALVSIRMAKTQGLPLSPEKISGPCGRLLCCLAYEHPIYEELLEGLPRKNAQVCTKGGVCGKVVKHHPLAQAVDLKTPEGKVVTATKEELEG